MVTILTIVYLSSLAICIVSGKKSKQAYLAKCGFIPLIATVVALACLEDEFSKWIED